VVSAGHPAPIAWLREQAFRPFRSHRLPVTQRRATGAIDMYTDADCQDYERIANHAYDPHCGQQAASILRAPLRRSAPGCSACTHVADHSDSHSCRRRGSLVEQPIGPTLTSRRQHRADGLAESPGKSGGQPHRTAAKVATAAAFPTSDQDQVTEAHQPSRSVVRQSRSPVRGHRWPVAEPDRSRAPGDDARGSRFARRLQGVPPDG
jgi:hypothetical protein